MLFQGTEAEFSVGPYLNSMHRSLKPCYRCPAVALRGGPQVGVRGSQAHRRLVGARSKREIVHHQQSTLVAIEHRSRLGAVEGDQRYPAGGPGLPWTGIWSGRVVGGHHDDLLCSGPAPAGCGVDVAGITARTDRGGDPANCPAMNGRP